MTAFGSLVNHYDRRGGILLSASLLASLFLGVMSRADIVVFLGPLVVVLTAKAQSVDFAVLHLNAKYVLSCDQVAHHVFLIDICEKVLS
ncbi:hypothetical protein Taro_010467 [Colocasia esculenta]|uniref:Uncharacterized protein n=1 Tax=Colocasia esculenta TaxID=4460 RepID=A0A843U8C8_COLES|nr:hypothetical protein [Colocasia esculenta]